MGLLGNSKNSKRTTNSIGDISEAAIIARFLQLGYVVLTVYGGNQRYDLSSRMPKANSGACSVNLRLVPAKNNQEKKVRWARDYEL
jgi:PD-(D/E)XK nuclease superfamily protein